MCVFISVGASGTADSHNAQRWQEGGGGRGGGPRAGFNQSLQPIELECVLVQWPTPD